MTQAPWFLRKSGLAQLGEERVIEGRHRLRSLGERQSELIYRRLTDARPVFVSSNLQ